jgi:hypothetical protein
MRVQPATRRPSAAARRARVATGAETAVRARGTVLGLLVAGVLGVSCNAIVNVSDYRFDRPPGTGGGGPDGGATGKCSWSKRAGDGTDQIQGAVTADPAGDVLVTGYFSGTMDLGCGPIGSAGYTDMYLAKLDPSGNCLWSNRYGAAMDEGGSTVAVDAAGNVLVAGYFDGPLELGCGPMMAQDAQLMWDLFVAKLGPDGSCQWSIQAGDDTNQDPWGIVADAAGNVLVAGDFEGTMDLGCGTLTSAGGLDAFVAKLDPAGNCLWSKGAGASGIQQAFAVGVDSAGDMLVTGEFYTSIDWGCGALTSAGASDVFVAKLGPDGGCLWSKAFGSGGEQWGMGVVADAADDLLVVGHFGQAIDFGCGGLVAGGSGFDVYAAKLDPEGNCLWSKRGGGADNQYGFGVAIDTAGNVAIEGNFVGTLDWGCGPMVGAGGSDYWVAKLDSAGDCLWSKAVGDAGEQYGYGVGVDAAGRVAIAGDFQGTVDIGCGPLTSAGGSDLFVAKLAP